MTIEDLRYAANALVDLNDWYRDHPVPLNFVYFETQPTLVAGALKTVLVVDAVSAEPGLSKDVFPYKKLAIDADHLTICKPRRGDQVDESVERVLKEIEEGLDANPPVPPGPIRPVPGEPGLRSA